MVLFVGDKPSPKMKPGAALFEGAACEARLKEWIRALEAVHFHISNSDSFVDITNVAMASRLYGAKIVALSNNASKRLSKHGLKHFKIPHPSFRNRSLNDPDFIAQKLAKCKIYLKNLG